MGGSSGGSSTTRKDIPEWLETASHDFIDWTKANVQDKPFVPYEGERVADFSGDQMSAFQQLRDLIAGAPNVGAEALDMVRTAGTAPAQEVATQQITPDTVKANLGDIGAYFNPHVDAMLDPALRKIQEA